jgi:hypothetical protein
VKHVIFETGKTFISLLILHQYWYSCPIALPARRNQQHRSILTVVSATSAPPFQPLRHQRNVCHRVVNRFTRQTLPTVNRKHFFIDILCIEFRAHKKRTTERCSSVVHPQARSPFWLLKPASEHKPARPVHRLSWSWTVLLPSDSRRTLLRPLQLFYFHLWPVYWLSLARFCLKVQ